MKKEKTFMKITNKMIYDEIQELKIHVINTNGKVKINYIVSRVALVLSIIAVSVVTGVNLMKVIG